MEAPFTKSIWKLIRESGFSLYHFLSHLLRLQKYFSSIILGSLCGQTVGVAISVSPYRQRDQCVTMINEPLNRDKAAAAAQCPQCPHCPLGIKIYITHLSPILSGFCWAFYQNSRWGAKELVFIVLCAIFGFVSCKMYHFVVSFKVYCRFACWEPSVIFCIVLTLGQMHG